MTGLSPGAPGAATGWRPLTLPLRLSLSHSAFTYFITYVLGKFILDKGFWWWKFLFGCGFLWLLLLLLFLNCWDTGLPCGLLSKRCDVMKLKREMKKNNSGKSTKLEGKGSETWIKGGLWTRSCKTFLPSSYTFSDLFWPFLFPAPCPLLPPSLFLESEGLGLLEREGMTIDQRQWKYTV